MKKERTSKYSETTMTEIVCPNDTNPMGILMGGKLVQWMDIASAVCAQNHAQNICVTASIDSVKFILPAKLGDIITIKAKITRSFNSSMEIFVQVLAKKISEPKAYLINEAFFTFVALDGNANPAPVPSFRPLTMLEKQEYKNAEKRKASRLKNN